MNAKTRRLSWMIAVWLVVQTGVVTLLSSTALGNNCTFSVERLRSGSTAFEATVIGATNRGEFVEYSLANVVANGSVPDDLVVVATPDDGISGASLRVGLRYWFSPNSTTDNEALVEICKFGITEDSVLVPPIFRAGTDRELDFTVDLGDPFDGIAALFTADIETARLVGDRAEYTVSNVTNLHGQAPSGLRLSTALSDGVFLVGERAWFRVDRLESAVAELPESHYGQHPSIPVMQAAFGLDEHADQRSIATTTTVALRLEPLVPVQSAPRSTSRVLWLGLGGVVCASVAGSFVATRRRT